MTASDARPALIAIAGVELGHRLLEARLRAVEIDAQRAEKLVVETVPRADAGNRLLGQDLLLGLGEDVRAELSDRTQPVLPPLEHRVGQQGVGRGVVEVGELEPEEQKLRVQCSALFGQPCQERSARRVGHVRREPEMGVVDRASEDRLDPLALVDRLDELGSAQLGDPAVVPLPERRCGGIRLLHVLLDAWIVTALVQVGEVPRDVFRTCQLCRRHVAGRYLREGSSRSPMRRTMSSSEWFRCWRKTRVTHLVDTLDDLVHAPCQPAIAPLAEHRLGIRVISADRQEAADALDGVRATVAEEARGHDRERDFRETGEAHPVVPGDSLLPLDHETDAHVRRRPFRLGYGRAAGEAFADVDRRLAVDELFASSSGTSSARPDRYDCTRLEGCERRAGDRRVHRADDGDLARRAEPQIEAAERPRERARRPSQRRLGEAEDGDGVAFELVVTPDAGESEQHEREHRVARGDRRVLELFGPRNTRVPVRGRQEEAAMLGIREELDSEQREPASLEQPA